MNEYKNIDLFFLKRMAIGLDIGFALPLHPDDCKTEHNQLSNDFLLNFKGIHVFHIRGGFSFLSCNVFLQLFR